MIRIIRKEFGLLGSGSLALPPFLFLTLRPAFPYLAGMIKNALATLQLPQLIGWLLIRAMGE